MAREHILFIELSTLTQTETATGLAQIIFNLNKYFPERNYPFTIKALNYPAFVTDILQFTSTAFVAAEVIEQGTHKKLNLPEIALTKDAIRFLEYVTFVSKSYDVHIVSDYPMAVIAKLLDKAGLSLEFDVHHMHGREEIKSAGSKQAVLTKVIAEKARDAFPEVSTTAAPNDPKLIQYMVKLTKDAHVITASAKDEAAFNEHFTNTPAVVVQTPGKARFDVVQKWAEKKDKDKYRLNKEKSTAPQVAQPSLVRFNPPASIRVVQASRAAIVAREVPSPQHEMPAGLPKRPKASKKKKRL